VKNNKRYAGMYADAETGLYYWGARYYDPKTGRGIQPDRMSVAEHVQRKLANLGRLNQPPLELNPYVYAANNPLRWIDPTGFVNVAPEYGPSPYYPPESVGDIGSGDDTSLGEFGAKMLGALFGAPLVAAVATEACVAGAGFAEGNWQTIQAIRLALSLLKPLKPNSALPPPMPPSPPPIIRQVPQVQPPKLPGGSKTN
jgi:RHS repeat-associated protein